VAAEVDLLQDSTAPGDSILATTDSAGRFLLTGIRPGTHVVRVRRIGFRAGYFAATFQPGEIKEVAIVIEPGEHELPEIVVTTRLAKPIEYAWTTRYDDFFRRRRAGFGTFLTRAEIEQKHPYRTPNILANLPGFKLRFRHLGPGGTDVYLTGCKQVRVWVDGSRQRFPDIPEEVRRRARTGGIGPKPDTLGMALGELLERVLPSQIELMEIYKGAARMPAEFLDDSCAAVVIWTR
jgi:hypothetical protein